MLSSRYTSIFTVFNYYIAVKRAQRPGRKPRREQKTKACAGETALLTISLKGE
jgi:hypothetical protein